MNSAPETRLPGAIDDHRTLTRWAFAAALFGAGLWARFALVGVLPPTGFPFLTFFPAVLLTAYCAGLGPALTVSFASVVAAWFFFLNPPASVQLGVPDMIALVFFGAILLVDCAVIHLMRNAMRRSSATQARLAASEQRVRGVLDGLFVHAWLLDTRGSVLEVNQAPLRARGLLRSDVLGRPIWDAPGWDGDPRERDGLRSAAQAAAAGQTVRQDLRLQADAVFDVQIGPVRDVAGSVVALLATAVDVSDRMRALDALERTSAQAQDAAMHAQAQQQLLDAVFNAVPASIIVANAQGALVRMNRATERVWGPAPASPGVDSYAQWKGWWADGTAHHGQPLAPSDWGLARSLHGETCTQQVEIEPFDRPGVRRTTLLSAAPVLDAQGHVVGGVVAQLDISDRVRAEAALRESEERFRTLADHIPQLAWIADADGSITWFNRRFFEFTGVAAHDRSAWGWRVVHHPDHQERVNAGFRKQLAAGEPWEDTFPMRARDGTYRWFLSRALPMKGPQGRVLRWFGTNTDVTDQRAIEQSLRDADAQKDIFLATLAHELRNPLAPIRSAAQIIALRHGGDERLARAAAVIERQSGQLARLVDDLLDLSRVRSGSLALRLRPGDLRQAIDGAVETIEPVLQAAGQTLELHLTDASLPLLLDEARAIQCIANVLHNASKFSPAGSRIELTAVREGKAARVRVRDPGQGIPSDMLPRMFDLFVQERHSGMAGHKGLGIGLALTRRLMELHGGSVRASSAGRDLGAEVELEWPIREVAPQAVS